MSITVQSSCFTDASPAQVYRHKKTGNLYEVFMQVLECTNSREGIPMIVYGPRGGVPLYVRERAEFLEKFEPLQQI
jgi:hypothetical protein